jgi:uncharacterized protein
LSKSGKRTVFMIAIAVTVIFAVAFIWRYANNEKDATMIEKLVRQFLYWPESVPADAKPPYYVVGAKEVWVESPDGNKIHGLHWPAPEGRPTILFFHGNAQTVFEWALIREELEPTECGLFLIDYPGYGKSTGSPSEASLYAAGQACYDWLTQTAGVPAQQVIIFGKSLGGGVSTRVAADNPARGLVLESTFTSIPSVAGRLLPMLPTNAAFKSERYESAKRIDRIDMPVLVIHGISDDLIPFSEGKALFEAAREPKEFYEVPGAGHNDVSMRGGREYIRRLNMWIESLP